MINIFGFFTKPKRKTIQQDWVLLDTKRTAGWGKLYDINDYMDIYACLYKLGRHQDGKPARIVFEADTYPLNVYSDTLNIYIKN